MIPDQNCPIKAAERYFNTNFYRVTRKKINDNPRTAPKHSPHLQHQCKPIKPLLKCTSTPYREATLLLIFFLPSKRGPLSNEGICSSWCKFLPARANSSPDGPNQLRHQTGGHENCSPRKNGEKSMYTSQYFLNAT